ncbi:hypothetical protein L600_000100001460 [Isoptericola variabilis J7]|nr:hypothetical protein L600_000100001460 [Isoptericola variabilis J7]
MPAAHLLDGGRALRRADAARREAGPRARGHEAPVEAVVARPREPVRVGELRERDGVVRRVRVLLGEQHEHRVGRDPRPHDPARGRRRGVGAHAHERDVERAGREVGGEVAHGPGHRRREGRAGQRRVEPVDEEPADGGVGGADAQRGPGAGAGVDEPPRVVDQGVHRREQHAGVAQDELAEGGRPRAGPVADEHRSAERPVDAVQLGRQCRLGQAEGGRRLGHAAALRDGRDHAQVSQLEVHASERYRPPVRLAVGRHTHETRDVRTLSPDRPRPAGPALPVPASSGRARDRGQHSG